MKKNQLIIDLSQYPELEDVSHEYLESSIYKLLMLIALSNGKKFLLPRVDIQPDPVQYSDLVERPYNTDGILGRTPSELVRDMLDHPAKMETMKSPPADSKIDSLILLRFLSILHMTPNEFLDRLFYTEDEGFKETSHYWRTVVELPVESLSLHNRKLEQVGLVLIGDIYYWAHFSETEFPLLKSDVSVDGLLLELKEHGFELALPNLSPEAEKRYGVEKFVEEQLAESMEDLLLRLTRKGEHGKLIARVLDDCWRRRNAVLKEKPRDTEEYNYCKHYPDLALMRFMFALSSSPKHFMDNMFLGAPDFFARKKKFSEFVGKSHINPDELKSIDMLEIGTVYSKVFDESNYEPIDMPLLNAELANRHFCLGDDGFNDRIVEFVTQFVIRNWNYSGNDPVGFLKDLITPNGGRDVLIKFMNNIVQDKKSTKELQESYSQQDRRNIVAFLALLQLDYSRFCNVLFEVMPSPENNDALVHLSKDLTKAISGRKVPTVAPNLYCVVSYRFRKSDTRPTQSQVEGAVRELCTFTSSDWLGKQIPNHIINDFCQLYVAVNVDSKSEDTTNPVTLVQERIFSHFTSIYEYATPRLPD